MRLRRRSRWQPRVPDFGRSNRGRLHLLALVQACDEFGARDELLEVLRETLGVSKEMDHLQQVFDENWPVDEWR